jgi:hypothetical protein
VRVLLALLLPGLALAQFTTTLNPKTTQEFDNYLKTAEPAMTFRAHYGTLKPGEVRVDPAKEDGHIPVKDGIIHDWVGAMFVPGGTPEQAIHVLQDYAAYKSVYPPEVVDSKLLSRSGDIWHVYLKLVKSKVLTAVLNTEYDVVYKDLGGGRWSMTSHSTRMAELDGAKELPLGTGHGFLWRLNAYWLIEARPGGVYLECRSISLSRDIPFGLKFVIGPFVKSLPSDSLRTFLTATANALLHTTAGSVGETRRLAKIALQHFGREVAFQQVRRRTVGKRQIPRKRTFIPRQHDDRHAPSRRSYKRVRTVPA